MKNLFNGDIELKNYLITIAHCSFMKEGHSAEKSSVLDLADENSTEILFDSELSELSQIQSNPKESEESHGSNSASKKSSREMSYIDESNIISKKGKEND